MLSNCRVFQFHDTSSTAKIRVQGYIDDAKYLRSDGGNLAAFLRALRRLLPELQMADLRRGGAGVRAQALLPDGTLADDFRILESRREIHVLNAPSPAATASLAIGRAIATTAQERLDDSWK